MRDEQADQVQTKKLQSGDVQKADDIHPTMKRAKVGPRRALFHREIRALIFVPHSPVRLHILLPFFLSPPCFFLFTQSCAADCAVGEGGVPRMQLPGASLLHDADALSRRRANGFLRVRKLPALLLHQHMKRLFCWTFSQPWSPPLCCCCCYCICCYISRFLRTTRGSAPPHTSRVSVRPIQARLSA